MENQNKKYRRGQHPNSKKNGFKKGHKVWLGKHLSSEHKEKLRLSKLASKNPMFGKKQSPEHIANRIKGNKGFTHSEETKKIIGEKHKGDKTKTWKGDDVGYTGVHSWVHRTYGKADRCENPNCPRKSKVFQWANISKNYKRNREDWIRLCVSCHQRWDRGSIIIII